MGDLFTDDFLTCAVGSIGNLFSFVLLSSLDWSGWDSSESVKSTSNFWVMRWPRFDEDLFREGWRFCGQLFLFFQPVLLARAFLFAAPNCVEGLPLLTPVSPPPLLCSLQRGQLFGRHFHGWYSLSCCWWVVGRALMFVGYDVTGDCRVVLRRWVYVVPQARSWLCAPGSSENSFYVLLMLNYFLFFMKHITILESTDGTKRTNYWVPIFNVILKWWHSL